MKNRGTVLAAPRGFGFPGGNILGPHHDDKSTAMNIRGFTAWA